MAYQAMTTAQSRPLIPSSKFMIHHTLNERVIPVYGPSRLMNPI